MTYAPQVFGIEFNGLCNSFTFEKDFTTPLTAPRHHLKMNLFPFLASLRSSQSSSGQPEVFVQQTMKTASSDEDLAFKQREKDIAQ